MSAHARLSPSSASRWLRCPGSVNFIDALDEADEAGTAADEGTILHSFCEDALRQEKDAYAFVGETRTFNKVTLTLDEDLAEMVQSGLDYINDIPGDLYIEKRINLDRWMPGQFGRLDVGVIGKRIITLFDWKWGGIPVSPIENEQEMIYALGFWDNIARHISKATKFRLVIWQPRAPGGGGEWEIELDELLAFGEMVRKAASETYDENAPCIPGPKQCLYCPGAKTMKCREYAAYNLALVATEFDDFEESMEMGIPPRLSLEMTPERRSYILEHRDMFTKFLDRLHAQALEDALAGRPTPGLKPVYGRNPPRKWGNAEEAEGALVKALGEDAYTKKIISPTQAEKELPKSMYEKVKPFVDHGQPKPTLVSEKDNRPAIPPLADMFDD